MSNVSAAFPQAKKLLLSSEKVVCELTESLKVEPLASSGSFQGLDQLEHTASSSVNQLLREVQHLHLLLQRESGSRRQAWASRIDSLSAQATCVRGDLERYFLNRNREELFGPRYRTETIQDHARTSAEMSHAEQNSLARSIQNVDGMTAIASTALESLRSQRRRLKNVHRNAIDMANYLGLSSSIIKWIEKRDRTDQIIVLIGMFSTIAIIAFLCYLNM